MLQRDYFIRIIEEFMAAISRFLEKDIDKRTDDDLRDLNRHYMCDYGSPRNSTAHETISYAREVCARASLQPKLEK